MKLRPIAYWVCTALVAFSFLSSGAAQIARVPQVVAGITALGYPPYFVTLLGVWKILGGLAILAPGLRRAKEWAYAGMLFDLSSAAISQAVMHTGAQHVIAPSAVAVLVLASWALRPESRRL